MSFASALSKILIQAAQKLTPPQQPRRSGLPYRQSHAGMVVSPEIAMTLAAVYRAVSYISESIMMLPWRVKRENSDGSITIVPDQLDFLLNKQANPELSARRWREAMLSYLLRWGNGYAEIVRNRRGEPEWLGNPIHPALVYVDRDPDTNLMRYRVTQERGGQVTLQANEMYHVPGLGDGTFGASVISYAGESMGISRAQERNVSSFFANGNRTSGILTHPDVLGEEVRDNLTNWINEKTQGPNNAFNALVLEEGMTWKQTGIPNSDAQLLESRNFSVVEIARWFGLPPHILMDYGRATWNNLEQATTEAVRSGLMPWATRLEAEADTKLLGRNRQRSMYTDIDMSYLLRADTDTRNRGYALGIQWGWFSQNDVLRDMGREPFDGGATHWVPANMNAIGAAETQGQQAQTDMQTMPQNMGPQSNAAIRTVVEDACKRIVTRETNQLGQHAKRDDFDDWFDKWLPKHSIYSQECLAPIASAINLMYPDRPVLPTTQLVDNYIEEIGDAVRRAHIDGQIPGYVENRDIWVNALADEVMASFEQIGDENADS